ncbi:PREDICTED: uncharacterized protein LOC105119420 isoform X1 [Populus euphratica]|uniref:Uncharacterized protein LOC105119420 isoform X1 n=1 Tax=Populus euphratica TaxID=75702 RepID=A0AAJ6TR02_POPEU|nr:PREDICTED: uncharacterized protein LOC105119420 isoform X1 [Populus euphratica]
MPSGAKKRKAARKKKEKEVSDNSSISSNNPQGNGDPKSSDERENDGGEIVSPVSLDQHNHQHPFNEGNGESEKGGPSPADSFAHQNKPMEGVPGDAEGSHKVELEDNSAIKIEREVNSEQNVESKDINEYVDCPKESHGEDDRSSSSGSSSNESQVFEKKSKEANDDEDKEFGSFPKEVKQIPENEKPVKEVNNNSVLETASAVYLVNPVVPISETVKFDMESAQVENSEVLEVVESGFEENEDRLLPISNEVVEVSPAIVVPKKNEDKVFPISNENVGASSSVVGSSVYGNLGKTMASSGSHSTETGNSADKNKDTDALESTENQLLLASAPQVAERTSCLSCCGLFDVFTGTNR